MNNLSLTSSLANKKVSIVLVLIIILGSVLRFYGLKNQSLWHDELLSYHVTNSERLSDVVHKGIHLENKIPGYFVILYLFTKYFGDSEAVLRLPSAISGVLSILVMFLLGVRLFSYKEGLIASALMATLLCPVYYSQEARPYSILLLFTMLSTYFWLSILQHLYKNTTIRYYYPAFGYVISAVISCYVHYYGLYLIMLQGLAACFIFVRQRKALCTIFLIYSPIVFAHLPWLPTMWNHFNSGVFSFLEPPAMNFFLLYLRFLFNFSDPLLLLVLALYTFLLLSTLHIAARSSKDDEARKNLSSAELLFLFLWLVVPYAGMHLVSKISAPLLHFRYLVISLPAAYLLVSRSITQLPVRSKIQTVVAGLTISLFLYHLLFIHFYYFKSQPSKTQYREAVAFVIGQDPSYEDSLIIAGAPSLDYYFEKHDSSRRVDIFGGSRWAMPEQKTAAARLVTARNPRYIWFICEHSFIDVEFTNFLADNHFSVFGRKKFFELDVWLFGNKRLIEKPDRT